MANLIMAPRVADAPKHKPELQPTVQPCDECGEDLFVAKSSREMMANHPENTWTVVCNQCAMELLQKQRERYPEHNVPLAVAETVNPDFTRRLQETVDRINKERGYEQDEEV